MVGQVIIASVVGSCHFLYSPALPLPPSPLMAPQQRKPAEMAEEKKKALHQYNDDHGHFSLVR